MSSRCRFTSTFSTGSSWQNLARRYSDIVDKQIAGDDLKKFTRDAVGNATARSVVIARALAAVEKNVRYAGVESVSRRSCRAPHTVLGNKYGDCKDKATLLVAMLREAGIAAHVALLRAGVDFISPGPSRSRPLQSRHQAVASRDRRRTV